MSETPSGASRAGDAGMADGPPQEPLLPPPRRWSRGATNTLIAPLIAAALLVTVVTGLSFWAYGQVEVALAARKHSYDLISRGNALLSAIKDAETGQRGYSLTGEEVFLLPYLAVSKAVTGDLQKLRQLTANDAAQKRLDALVPLVNAKMADMAEIIALRRDQKMTALLAAAGASGQGRYLMESIRIEMGRYVQIQEGVLAQNGESLRTKMRDLFALIVVASLFTFLFALTFAWLIYRETQHRLKGLLHSETRHLLGVQEGLNKELQDTNFNLHVTEERLAVTLNSIGDAVIATDADGRVTVLNPLAQKLTGWTLAEAADRPVEEIFHIINAETRLPSVVPVKDALMHNAIQGMANHTILIARDGSECHIADSCAPIRERGGRAIGAILVFRDVTESRRHDDILHERSVALEKAKSVAEKANLAKSDFLSSMSHELRTPLSAILGFAQLMESGSPQPTIGQKRSIEQILKAGWYLLDLINEILDLALIESGKLSLSIEPMSLSDVLREAEALIEPQAQQRGVRLTFPRLDGGCFVNADRTRVKQVLVNLLSNAVKYNTAGGAVVVDVVAVDARRIRVNVNDTGAGLSAQQLTQLFQPFNRLGQEAGTEEGTGIGLVVCKRLVEMMGGEIGVASTPGKGSMFWFELNATPAPVVVAAAGSAALAPPQPESGAQSRTLLYVEDNQANMMLVADIIARRPDIRMLSATDGFSGVEMARATLPDVILMDINLPGISGIHALEILAANPATAHIPVIALSANAMPRDIEKGLAAGFFRYLTKPIRVIEFLETLDVALKFAESQPALNAEEEKI